MEQADHWVDGGGTLPLPEKAGPFTLASGGTALADLRKGQTLTVAHIAVTPDTGHRLTGLGIRKGVALTVLRNAGKGPLLVAVGGTRVDDIPALLRALGEGANFRGLPGKNMGVLRKK